MVGRRIIAKIKGSKDGKVLLSNFAYLSLLQVAGYVFPLLTLPYLARVIGASGFGKIAFASAIMVWIQTVTDWGFNYTATRDVARCRDDNQRVSEIFSNVFWARCLLMVLSFVVLTVLVFTIPKLRAEADVIFVSFLMIPGHILFPDWFFQAIERMKYITILNLLSKTLFTIAVFLFIKDSDDYILQPLFVSLGFVVSGIIAMYFILRRWHVKLMFLSWCNIVGAIKQSTPVFINNIVPNLYTSFSTIMLGVMHGNVATGIMGMANKVADAIQAFMQIVARVFFPFLSRRDDGTAFRKYALMHMGIACVFFLSLFATSPLLFRMLGVDEFAGTSDVLRILSFCVVFSSLNYVYGVNWLLVNGYEKQLRNITVSGSVVGFVLAWPLIYKYDCYGAAFTITMTKAIIGIATMLAVKILRK